MHDFFDKLGAAAKRAASSVAVEVNVAAEEQKIKEGYQALGKLYYQAVRAGQEPAGAEFTDCCNRITEGLRRIGDLKSNQDVTGTYSEVYAESSDFVDAE